MPTDRSMEGYLKDELKAVNAHLPRTRKSLAQLLAEHHPHVLCSDGGRHYFRRKELDYLGAIIPEKEYDMLLLPILLEVSPEAGEFLVHSKHGIETSVLSRAAGMTIECREGIIRMGRSQVSAIRSALETTTQYVFRP